MQNGLDWNKRLPLSAQYTNKKDSPEVRVRVKSGGCVYGDGSAEPRHQTCSWEDLYPQQEANPDYRD